MEKKKVQNFHGKLATLAFCSDLQEEECLGILTNELKKQTHLPILGRSLTVPFLECQEWFAFVQAELGCLLNPEPMNLEPSTLCCFCEAGAGLQRHLPWRAKVRM